MLRSMMIAAAAAGLLAIGALSAMAGNAHGKAVSTLATSTTLKGEAKSDSAKAAAAAKAAETDVEDADEATTDEDTNEATTDEDTDEATTDGDANEATDEAAVTTPAAAPATKTEKQGAEHDD